MEEGCSMTEFHQSCGVAHNRTANFQSGAGSHRMAFSILELLIALGLLGALLSVAWSLLGTYRRAEEQGWSLAERTQSIRLVRELLERDLLQIALPDGIGLDPQPVISPSSTDSGLESGPSLTNLLDWRMQPSFEGNQFGFKTVVFSSIDPMPFLERLLGESEVAVTKSSGVDFMESGGISTRSLTKTGDDAQASIASSPWSPELISVEYRLRQEVNQSTSKVGNSGLTSGMATQDALTEFLLVRIERTELPAASTTDSLKAIESSERILSASDLYRTDEQERVSESQVLRESVISRLSRARFSYFDGSQWKSSWVSRTDGRLPVAVSLIFDLERGSSTRKRGLVVSPEIESDSTLESLFESGGTDEADSNAEISDESSFDKHLSQAPDVRVVVRLWQAPGTESRVTQ